MEHDCLAINIVFSWYDRFAAISAARVRRHMVANVGNRATCRECDFDKFQGRRMRATKGYIGPPYVFGVSVRALVQLL